MKHRFDCEKLSTGNKMAEWTAVAEYDDFFDRYPREIRDMVYGYVYAGGTCTVPEAQHVSRNTIRIVST